jgi:hypothetical protein
LLSRQPELVFGPNEDNVSFRPVMSYEITSLLLEQCDDSDVIIFGFEDSLYELEKITHTFTRGSFEFESVTSYIDNITRNIELYYTKNPNISIFRIYTIPRIIKTLISQGDKFKLVIDIIFDKLKIEDVNNLFSRIIEQHVNTYGFIEDGSIYEKFKYIFPQEQERRIFDFLIQRGLNINNLYSTTYWPDDDQ